MFRRAITRCLGDRQKRAIKARLNDVRQRIIRALAGYDAAKLKAALRSMGVAESDTLLVHSNFQPDSGFLGTPQDIVGALAESVGAGNLMMVSIPFRGSAYDYLSQGKVFDARKTFSMMGLITELFRRREGTLRSLHPTHPVLAYGKDASWLVSGHEACRFPCGPGTPFEKFRTLNGKILFFDVGFEAITFFHYVEDLIKEGLPFPVYDDRLFTTTVIDVRGHKHTVETQAFSKAIRRRADKLGAEMERRGKIRRGSVGNSRMLLVSAEEVVTCFAAMVEAGNFPFEVVDGSGQGRQQDHE